MFRRAVKWIGYLLVAAIFVGMGLAALTAARNGEAFYGVSHFGLPLGSYSTLAMLGMIVLIGAAVIATKVVKAWQVWRSRPTRT